MRARAVWALFAALAFAACASRPTGGAALHADGRYVMGTVLEITLGGVSKRAADGAFPALFAEAQRLDRLMTLFDSKSQISALNASAGGGPMAVDPDVAVLLRRSAEYRRLTGGTFDVTIGPLVQLWIDAAVDGAMPTPVALARARALVGDDAIRVHPDDRVELARAGVRVDLGGVAKGFALDRMRPLLESEGIDSALLSFGQSSTLALGQPPEADGWRLLVRGPTGEVLGVITLSDQALSVSSSFGHWVKIEGRRFGHVIDPRSGQPLTSPLQAHVLAPDATLAEALSKALLILPPEEGIALITKQQGCEGMLIDADGRVLTTTGWGRRSRWSPIGSDSGSSDAAVPPIEMGWPSKI